MEPRKYASNNISGAICEIISAMSALAMEPQEKEGRSPEAIYLCDIDYWANHAVEHLHQAVEFLGQEDQHKFAVTNMSIVDILALLTDIRHHIITLEADEQFDIPLRRATAELDLAYCTLTTIKL